MPALTVEDCANMALDLVDEAPIGSLEDDTKAARLLNRHFETTREAELSAHAWSFATIITETESEDTEIDGYERYKYSVPDDALRVLPLTNYGWPYGSLVSFSRRADGIYTNESGPLQVAYIANLVDPSEWPAQFVEVFTAALAKKIALPLTQKPSSRQIAAQAYEEALERALRTDAILRHKLTPPDSWRQQRGDPSWAAR